VFKFKIVYIFQTLQQYTQIHTAMSLNSMLSPCPTSYQAKYGKSIMYWQHLSSKQLFFIIYFIFMPCPSSKTTSKTKSQVKGSGPV